MKLVVLAVLLSAAHAHAQIGPGSEVPFVLVVGPPTLLSVMMDLTLASTLVPHGTAPKGRAITTLVFASVGIVLSGLCLGLGARSSPPWWMAASGSALALDVGSIGVAVYALLHAETEEEPVLSPEPPPAPDERRSPVEPPPPPYPLPL